MSNPGSVYKMSFSTYKRKSVRIAMDLCYPPEVIKRIKNAKTEIEIDNILALARKES